MAELGKVIKGLECCDGNGVKCDSCPYWQDVPDEYQVSCNDYLCREAKEVIEEAYTTIGRCYSKIDELIEKEWTSVDERLPEEDGFYLVCNYGYLPWIAELKTFKCIRGWCNSANMPVVKMWMPLPKTPKDGEQE